MSRNRVNADHLATLLKLGSCPRKRNNWMRLHGSDADHVNVLVEQGLANKETLADESAYQLTPRGREVCAAMFRAAHKEIFWEDQEYRG